MSLDVRPCSRCGLVLFLDKFSRHRADDLVVFGPFY